VFFFAVDKIRKVFHYKVDLDNNFKAKEIDPVSAATIDTLLQFLKKKDKEIPAFIQVNVKAKN
jgi:isopentenyldiphosphate isomerase